MLATPAPFRQRLRAYATLMRMDRPIGTLLLLWPTYWGLWLAARGTPSLGLFLIFTTGTWLMRSAGCVINDYFDRDFDRQVARTCQRPLATGLITSRAALRLFVILCLLAAVLLPFLNWLTIWLAGGAVLITVTYPLFKRFTHLPQAYLGIAFSFGIPMAFAATLGRVPALAWWLMLANACWVVAYDTAYAMADRPDDLKAGIKSTAILFGRFDRYAIAGLQAIMLIIFSESASRWACIGLIGSPWQVPPFSQPTSSLCLAATGIRLSALFCIIIGLVCCSSGELSLAWRQAGHLLYREPYEV